MKIAAVQFDAAFTDVNSNLIKAGEYVKQAALNGAELILFPEFFTSAIGFSDKMLDVAAKNNVVQKLLVKWSSENNIIIGGSYICFDGFHAYNLFELIFPNGDIYNHKKDIPTQFENCYYTDGDKNNILYTPIGNIAVALCWEMIRYDTIKRIFSEADIVLAGSCWWDLPDDAPPERESLRKYNRQLAIETPVTFAAISKLPVIHANHCGKITAYNFPANDKIQTRRLVGGTQFIDANGSIIARRSFDEGEGLVISNISWDVGSRKKSKSDLKTQRYWIPDLPETYIKAWENINPKGKQYYENIANPHYKASQQTTINHLYS